MRPGWPSSVRTAWCEASFVPPEPIRQLRDLTRARTAITRERAREAQRLEKLLEDAGIKLSAVASDILGVSGRAMLEALIAGDRDPAVLADLAKRRLRTKIPELTEALNGRFNEHHAFLAQVHLDLIDRHTAAINKLTARIEVVIEPFQGFRDLICTIPGISTLTADVIVAETGADMSRFPTAKHLASWAGTTPGQQRVRRQGEVEQDRGRATPTCKAPSAPPRWPAPRTRAPTTAPATDASPAGADPRRPTSRSSTPCSSRSGTWAPPAPSTTTPAPTTSPDSTPNRAKKRAIHQLEAMGYRVTLDNAS